MLPLIAALIAAQLQPLAPTDNETPTRADPALVPVPPALPTAAWINKPKSADGSVIARA